MPDTTFRAWMEIAYFASGIAVAVVASLALWQLVIAKKSLDAAQAQLSLAAQSLNLAKDDIRIRSQREAVALAAQECDKFAEKMVPNVHENEEKIKAAGFTIYRWPLKDLEFRWESLESLSGARKWAEAILRSDAARMPLLRVVNDLEAFAMYFSTGAADEKVADPAVGSVFCLWVEAYAPYIISVRSDAAEQVVSGPYENVVTLYRIWSGRRRKKRLETDVSRMSLELSTITVPDVRPIGTNSGA